MRKAQVKLNNRYYAKVSGQIVPVRIVSESRLGGWDAVNERTGRDVRIKSAGKLRGEVGVGRPPVGYVPPKDVS